MQSKLLAICLAAAVSVSGCASLSSAPQTDFTQTESGLSYFLPMRMVRLTATRTPQSVEKLIKDRDEKVLALAAARTAASAAAAKRDLAKAVLEALAETSPARADQVKALDLAVAEAKVAKEKADALDKEVNDLRGQIIEARRTGSPCRHNAKLELLPVQADPRARFVLAPEHWETRDETHNFALTPAGLLSSTRSTVVDQTGQTIVDIAGALGMVAGSTARTLEGGPPAPPPPACEGPPLLNRVFDPASKTQLDDVNAALLTAHFPLRLAVIEAGQEITGDFADRIPKRETTTVTGADGRATERVTRAPGVYYRSAVPLLLEVRQGVEIAKSEKPKADTTVQNGGSTDASPAAGSAAGSRSATTDGQEPPLRPTPPAPVSPERERPNWDGTTLTPTPEPTPPVNAGQTPTPSPQQPIQPALFGDYVTIDAVVLVLPQAGPVSLLPFRASPFVRTVNDVQFADGSLTTWSTERPGALPAAARVPGQALEAFVAAFSRAIALRIDMSTSREELGSRRAETIYQDALNQALVACVYRSGSDGTDPRLCLPPSEN